jgi:hypothetical protein
VSDSTRDDNGRGRGDDQADPRPFGQPYEEPLEGWKDIAREVRLSIETAQRRARRRRDPLPTWKYERAVIAWRSALQQWMARSILPLQVAERLEAIERKRRRGPFERRKRGRDFDE